jgi:hypothetical protein
MSLLYVALALATLAVLGWLINTRLQMGGRIQLIANVVLALVAVGMVLGLINTYIPMAGSIKAILNIVVVVATCVGVLQTFGLWRSTLRLWSKITSHRPASGPPAEPGTTRQAHP